METLEEFTVILERNTDEPDEAPYCVVFRRNGAGTIMPYDDLAEAASAFNKLWRAVNVASGCATSKTPPEEAHVS